MQVSSIFSSSSRTCFSESLMPLLPCERQGRGGLYPGSVMALDALTARQRSDAHPTPQNKNLTLQTWALRKSTLLCRGPLMFPRNGPIIPPRSRLPSGWRSALCSCECQDASPDSSDGSSIQGPHQHTRQTSQFMLVPIVSVDPPLRCRRSLDGPLLQPLSGCPVIGSLPLGRRCLFRIVRDHVFFL